MNLVEGLLDEMNRVREIKKLYESLPDGVGMIGASIMDHSIKQAEKAVGSGDIMKMLPALQELKGFKD